MIADTLKDYASKRLELLKIEATEKSSLSAGFIVFLIFSTTAVLFFIILFNIGLGLLIGHYLGNYGYGVLIMAGIYLLLFLLLLLLRKALTATVANKVIKLLNQ